MLHRGQLTSAGARLTHLPRVSTQREQVRVDRSYRVHFRPRPTAVPRLVEPSDRPRTADPSCVCLFSGGLDSFIGAIDLLQGNEDPFLVSHYWDGITSKHQTDCARALQQRFPAAALNQIRARVGFPNNIVAAFPAENTLRGRSFLFFALAVLAANAIGGDVVIHMPENGLISLNVASVEAYGLDRGDRPSRPGAETGVHVASIFATRRKRPGAAHAPWHRVAGA
jgi:hypothetical protein